MAGGSTAPTEITDGTSHINPTYDSDEDGQVEAADVADDAALLDGKSEGQLNVNDADTLDGNHASAFATGSHYSPNVQASGDVSVSGEGHSIGYDLYDDTDLVVLDGGSVETVLVSNPGYRAVVQVDPSGGSIDFEVVTL